MNASDIMTAPVITVGPDTAVRHIARLLYEHRISAVPVVENAKLVGIVSEADLLHRHEIGTDHNARTSSWWLQLLSADRSVTDYVKSHATHARDIMTKEVVSVSPDASIAEIANLLEKRGVKRVPVVHDKRVVGIVSRSNLVQALAIKGRSINTGDSGDGAIRKRLLAELEAQSWWRAEMSNVIVTDGVVHYFGSVESDQLRQAARVAAENVPGVRSVEDHRVPLSALTWSV
ncbi:MAG TPA: CBS domain-containing protein [Burkholderiales bacterium]|nr:CBS domain-containing protein [Burkholderiales bacterium]